MTLRDLIRELDDGGDIRDVAERVVKTIMTDHLDMAEELVLPLIREAIRRRRRTVVRRDENAAFRSREAAQRQGRDPGDALQALRELRNSLFWEPTSGEMVSWAAATADEHEARAAWVTRMQIEPLQLDVERHMTAAGIIETAGVNCLAEVEGY